MKKIFMFLSIAMLLCGCNSTSEKQSGNNFITPTSLSVPVSKIEDITTRLKTNNTDIGTLSQGISEKAEKIAIENPKIKEAAKVKLDAEKINLINTENIKNTNGLDVVKEQLVQASVQIEELKKVNVDLKSQIEKSKSELQNGMNKILLLTYALCVLGIAGGVILMFFNQQNNGMIVLCVSVAMMGLVYFLQTYAWILGILSGVLFIGLLCSCVYKIYIDQKTKIELVKSYETIKTATKYEHAEKLAVTNIQSDNTINEVKKIKENIGLQ